jgi:hypothetical protein
MNPENIPLVMLFSFSGFLMIIGLLAVKGMQRQERRDDVERRGRNNRSA